MNIHEYQGKGLLRKYGVITPRGVPCFSVDEAVKAAESLGGKVRYGGHVTGLLIGEVEDLWDLIAMAEYPSLAAFQQMAMSPQMHAIEHHRTAGLAGQLNIRTKPGAGF